MKEIAKGESEKVKQLKKLNKEIVSDYGKLFDEIKSLKEELAGKDKYYEGEMKKLYSLMHEVSAERDVLKEQNKGQHRASSPELSKDLLRENKQMKAFFRSIMNTCDTVRELEIA